MTAVLPSDSTYSFIERKVRRLTASASESMLRSAEIQQAVNLFYSQDFPYAIKLDQTRQVYKFLTIPNVDRYPVDDNLYQGFRAPVYFQGVQGNFFKNRDQLFNLFPRFPIQFQQSPTTIVNIITAIALPSGGSVRITTPDTTLLKTGDYVTINDVVGTVELNGNTYQIQVLSINSFALVGTNGFFFTPYVSGGTWITTNTTFSFTLFGNNVNPFPQPNFGILSTQVVIGGIDINGNPIRIIDDGGGVVNSYGVGSNTTQGRLLFINQNNVGDNVFLTGANIQKPAIPDLSPIPIPSPPVSLTRQYCGTVNYLTTEINIVLPVDLMPGTQLNIWCSTYQVGRPYNLLFWNNEFTIRPVPDNVYLCEVEVYQTPSQFMMTNDNPVLNQWAQYLAYGASLEILRDRQDMEGVQNLMEGFQRQEGLVLERQACEEIGQPNITLFNSTQLGYGYGTGYGNGAGGY